jgi:hypothetical protein
MALLSISSYFMTDPNYRFALMYNLLDRKICEIIHDQFGEANVRFQIKIKSNKVNIGLWYLDKYYNAFFKTNEKRLIAEFEQDLKKFQIDPKKPYKVYISYYGTN